MIIDDSHDRKEGQEGRSEDYDLRSIGKADGISRQDAVHDGCTGSKGKDQRIILIEDVREVRRPNKDQMLWQSAKYSAGQRTRARAPHAIPQH